ncbi:CLUMA_CG004855, isoform A [Clunio marinus]|uniref:CLUMA_CG004855, isoform A n=1 Tax=Clunio marinus TaxID=568069 RepID=A0A1J1HUE3_9DIPT|nr:CLUMA_CG004855, isoform A [Clunio marinus]
MGKTQNLTTHTTLKKKNNGKVFWTLNYLPSVTGNGMTKQYNELQQLSLHQFVSLLIVLD